MSKQCFSPLYIVTLFIYDKLNGFNIEIDMKYFVYNYTSYRISCAIFTLSFVTRFSQSNIVRWVGGISVKMAFHLKS